MYASSSKTETQKDARKCEENIRVRKRMIVECNLANLREQKKGEWKDTNDREHALETHFPTQSDQEVQS